MVALIPARGGSKGLKGKNTKDLLGKPLLAYSIEAALHAKSVSDVIVSTDDLEIAEVAKQYGARVPFLRPPQLASDDSPAIDTYIHAIEFLEKEYRHQLLSIVVLLPTCPLRTSTHIDEAIELFMKKDADSVVSYTEEEHPIYWHKKINDDFKLVNIWNQEHLNNRQAYSKTYYPNGAIYVFKKDIIKQRQYYSEESFAYIMPRTQSVDIDTIDDFMLAEFYLQHNAL